MSRWFLGVTVLFLAAGAASANIPDPSLCDIPPVLMVPANPPLFAAAAAPQIAALGYSVQIIGNLGPVANALVEIVFSPAAEARIAWCNGADGHPTSPHPVITAVTNLAGIATFRIAGGGCILPNQVNPYAVEVKANNVLLQSDVAVYSVDAVNAQGQTSAVSGTNSCEPTPAPAGPNKTSVGLSDAVFHTGDFAGITFNRCSDFDNSGTANLSDAVIGTQFIVESLTCTCDP